MSLKKIGQVKEGKYFRIWDLVIYGVIALIIAALFLAVFLTKDNSSAEGFAVKYAGKTVFTYYYSSNKYEVNSAYGNITVEEENGEKLLLTFRTDDKNGYNKIEIDKINKSVKVTDANCSMHKDCVYTPALKDNSSIISCPPHNMLIEPLLVKVDDPQELPLG